MRLDELFTRLLELDFHDRWPLLDELAKHKGKRRFIHFTKPVEKVGGQRSPDQYKFGINPVPNSHWRKPYGHGASKDPLLDPKGRSAGMTVKTHNDPEGIYFYPIDWLFSDHERMRSGDQFALNWPRWYVIDVDWSAPGMVLSKVTWDDVEALADRNGWRDLLDEYRTNPEKFKNALPYWVKPDHAAGVMWGLLNHFQSTKTISWRKAFKGVAYIYDDNNSIIYSHEPHQLLVLDPKIVKLIDSGDQHTQPLQSRDQNSALYWSGAIKKLFQRLRGSRGGQIVWKAKSASYQLEEGGCKFSITFDGSWKTGVRMRYSWGRAIADWFGEFKSYANIDELAAAIEGEMDKAQALAKRKQDLLFKPLVSIEDARKFIETKVAGDQPVKFETEIFNEKHPYYRVSGTYAYSIGKTQFVTEYRAIGHKDEFSIGLEISANGEGTGRASAKIERGEQLDDLLPDLKSKLDRAQSMVLALKSDQSSSYKFYSDTVYKEFLGWLALNSNLNTENVLNNYLADNISAYDSRNDADLARDVDWAFRRSRW